MNIEEVRDTLEAAKQDFPMYGIATAWSVIYDQKNKEAIYYNRMNYKHGFHIKL